MSTDSEVLQFELLDLILEDAAESAELTERGLAYQGKGDGTKAAEFFQRAADQNSLPALNYAFVRSTAKKMKA